MTQFKAGDKVFWNDDMCEFIAYNHNEEYCTLKKSDDDTFTCKASYVRHATPVEIARQKLMDEIASISNNISPVMSALLDSYETAVRIEATEQCLDTIRKQGTVRPEYASGGRTESGEPYHTEIIGKPNKID